MLSLFIYALVWMLCSLKKFSLALVPPYFEISTYDIQLASNPHENFTSGERSCLPYFATLTYDAQLASNATVPSDDFHSPTLPSVFVGQQPCQSPHRTDKCFDNRPLNVAFQYRRRPMWAAVCMGSFELSMLPKSL
ncbi:hypothetical protein C8R48DRAFT_16280 [Suillus tomentosus]|nr:hypothetical protein C8R48DRAFT_16280 [Suillus tomentosus]